MHSTSPTATSESKPAPSHTPAPWSYEPGKDTIWGGQIPVAYVSQHPDSLHVGQGRAASDANARLIASAPDLLAELREAVRLMPLGSKERAEWMRHASAAIAKATQPKT